ncbi:MAG: hypothetical protein LKI94_02780, partial [Sporolactobacillus sp.]|nr:hypothetical protein [Sporolactobacillus sp.]
AVGDENILPDAEKAILNRRYAWAEEKPRTGRSSSMRAGPIETGAGVSALSQGYCIDGLIFAPPTVIPTLGAVIHLATS